MSVSSFGPGSVSGQSFTDTSLSGSDVGKALVKVQSQREGMSKWPPAGDSDRRIGLGDVLADEIGLLE